MKRLHGAHRGIALALVAVAAAICIAACGGSSNASTTTKTTTPASTTTPAAGARTGSRNFTALQACLKKHGVTLPARRAGGGFGGGRFGGSTGTGTAPTGTAPNGAAPGGTGVGTPGSRRAFLGNSKFAKAFKACGAAFGGGGFGAGGFRNGTPGFRRPAFTKAKLDSFVACIRKNGYPQMPEPKSSSTGGRVSVFPASVEQNAKFKAALPKCESILRTAPAAPQGGGSNQSGTGTTSTS